MSDSHDITTNLHGDLGCLYGKAGVHQPIFALVDLISILVPNILFMKFGKLALITLTLLTTIIGTIAITSCEKNSCDGVNCMNGGSCGYGECNCPVGWEDARCTTRKTDRYVGTYAGYLYCDNGAPTIDTVKVVTANRGILSVDVYLKSLDPKVLQGYVTNNEAAYTITITNNDSSKAGSTYYLRTFDVTLQSDKSLKLHYYEHDYTEKPDTTQHSCQFVGMKLAH